MYVDSRGVAVHLGPHLGRGAEGDVYEVSRPGLVAKLLHPASRTPERQAKLRVMVVRAPKDPSEALGHPTLCWPRELVFDGAELVGFLMPRLDLGACLPLHRFVFPRLYPASFHWGLQLEIADNLAAGLTAVHAEGYVVGDLNVRNVYVSRRCLITFLDCDSMQVTDPASGRVLRCPVGMPEYMAPELQTVALGSVDRTEASDSFAFAVMTCQLLLTGTHPFAGGRRQTREENILANDCFLLGGNVPRGTPPPAILPPPLLDLLVRCFRDGYRNPRSRPRLQEFAQVLALSRGQVSPCGAFPTHHVFSSHLASCPWCDQLRLRIDSYRAGALAVANRAAAQAIANPGGAYVPANPPAAQAAANPGAAQVPANPGGGQVPGVPAAAPAGQTAAAGTAAAGQAFPPAPWVPHQGGGPPPRNPLRSMSPALVLLCGVAVLALIAHLLGMAVAISRQPPWTVPPPGGSAPTFRLTTARPDPANGAIATAAGDQEAEPGGGGFRLMLVDWRPVTERGFQSCLDAGWCDPSPERERCMGGRIPAVDDPAVCVTWNDATAFCKKQRQDLPSQSAWVDSRLAGGRRGAPREWVKEGVMSDGFESATTASVAHDDRGRDLGFRCASSY